MKRIRWAGLTLGVVLGVLTSQVSAAPPKFDEVVKKVSGTFEPAKVAPGQVVTLTITAELADDWYTYPLEQVDPNPMAEYLVNTLILPKPEESGLTFGKVSDPEKPKVKSEPALGIKELHILPGSPTWTAKAKVSPDLKPGTYTFKVKFKMQVCGKPSPTAESDVCLLPKTVEIPVQLTVVSGQ